MSVIVGARDPRRARRAEAGASPDPLRDARARARPDALQEVRARRRRRDGQVPPARRHGGLRRARAHGAGLLDALPADRRAGQLRLASTAIRRRPCATPRRAWRESRTSCSRDIDKDTVDFQPNYDEHASSEPSVLPARFPNLLVNGSGGIAVGMATNIPPHNLGEIDRRDSSHLIDDPDADVDDLMQFVQGPGLPDRRDHLRHRGHPRGVPHRARPHHRCARAPTIEERRGRTASDRRHRDPLPGEQGAADREDRRARQRQALDGDQRHHATSPTGGHARRDRAQARRRPAGRAQQALQAHPAADRPSASTCSRWSTASPRTLGLRRCCSTTSSTSREVVTRRHAASSCARRGARAHPRGLPRSRSTTSTRSSR